jgi:exonuclease SbcC
VIDDPVQSMDEVHIAQFAALLRTLSKQMHRQVIIAVHERALFDYLALELSPAFEGDRLNVVELGRNASGQTTCRWDAHQFIADQAIAV